jgi:hypothetical protein
MTHGNGERTPSARPQRSRRSAFGNRPSGERRKPRSLLKLPVDEVPQSRRDGFALPRGRSCISRAMSSVTSSARLQPC